MAHESNHNYSSIPLAAAAEYIGLADVVSEYASVAISVLADQDGSLELQESFNGSVWYVQETIAVEAASVPMTVVRPAIGRHFRLRFENTSGDDQTVFNLSCKYLDSPADVTISNTADLASEATLAAAAGELTSINGKITACNTAAVLLVARSTAGTANNLVNNATLVAGASSATVDTTEMDIASVWLYDSSTSSVDSYAVRVSVDGGTSWFGVGVITPEVIGSVRMGSLRSIDLAGVDALRVENISGSDDYTGVTAGVLGSAR